MKSLVYSKYFQLGGKYKLEFYSARIKYCDLRKKTKGKEACNSTNVNALQWTHFFLECQLASCMGK
jgi:hypothetical protein